FVELVFFSMTFGVVIHALMSSALSFLPTPSSALAFPPVPATLWHTEHFCAAYTALPLSPSWARPRAGPADTTAAIVNMRNTLPTETSSRERHTGLKTCRAGPPPPNWQYTGDTHIPAPANWAARCYQPRSDRAQ